MAADFRLGIQSYSFRTYKTLDALIDAMHGKVFLNRPERDGNRILVTKAPKFPKEHTAATSPEERRYYFCHCDNIRANTGKVSLTYCFCGAAWCKRIWEYLLERPVKIEITQSVLQDDDTCQFAVNI